jgi:hypothetical protein
MMEGTSDGDGMFGKEGQVIYQEKEARIKKGCTAGRIVNIAIALIYFLVLLTALIVSGIFGVLNSKVILSELLCV